MSAVREQCGAIKWESSTSEQVSGPVLTSQIKDILNHCAVCIIHMPNSFILCRLLILYKKPILFLLHLRNSHAIRGIYGMYLFMSCHRCNLASLTQPALRVAPPSFFDTIFCDSYFYVSWCSDTLLHRFCHNPYDLSSYSHQDPPYLWSLFTPTVA